MPWSRCTEHQPKANAALCGIRWRYTSYTFITESFNVCQVLVESDIERTWFQTLCIFVQCCFSCPGVALHIKKPCNLSALASHVWTRCHTKQLWHDCYQPMNQSAIQSKNSVSLLKVEQCRRFCMTASMWHSVMVTDGTGRGRIPRKPAFHMCFDWMLPLWMQSNLVQKRFCPESAWVINFQ